MTAVDRAPLLRFVQHRARRRLHIGPLCEGPGQTLKRGVRLRLTSRFLKLALALGLDDQLFAGGLDDEVGLVGSALGVIDLEMAGAPSSSKDAHRRPAPWPATYPNRPSPALRTAPPGRGAERPPGRARPLRTPSRWRSGSDDGSGLAHRSRRGRPGLLRASARRRL